MNETDILVPADRSALEHIAEEAARGASMCGQIALVTTVTEATKRELHALEVQLVGVSSRISRIVILAD